MKKLYTKNIIIMMALFLTLSLNAQNKTEYMSYFASDSTTANVCINGIDNIHTCIFNFHKDNIMTINGKEYYVATVYQWKFGYETTSASYYNNEYNILLREETETGRLYRYDMEGEKEILVSVSSEFCLTYVIGFPNSVLHTVNALRAPSGMARIVGITAVRHYRPPEKTSCSLSAID